MTHRRPDRSARTSVPLVAPLRWRVLMARALRFAPRSTSITLMLACAILGAALAPGVHAPAGAQAPTLNGTWRLQGDPTQAQTTIAQTIEPAVSVLAPDIQRLARARIAETTWIPSTITIAATTARISVSLQGAENRTFDTPPGQPQNVYTRSGVRAQMTQSFRPDGGIEQQFVAMDGTQWNILLPDSSGRTLYLDVRMRSPRLTQEITFRLVYQRAG